MGELLDALNAADTGRDSTTKSAIEQAAKVFKSSSQRVNEVIDAAGGPGMSLDKISKWTREMPLQALAVAFLLGVMTARRR